MAAPSWLGENARVGVFAWTRSDRNSIFLKIIFGTPRNLSQFSHLSSNYNVLRRLVGGAFGEVYLCQFASPSFSLLQKRSRWWKLRRKGIRLGGRLPAEVALREVSALARISHPHIVQYHGCWREIAEGQTYLFIKMDFCQGGSLVELVESCELHGNLQRIWRIVASTLDALTFIHQRNIIHRDIKPVGVLQSAWNRRTFFSAHRKKLC